VKLEGSSSNTGPSEGFSASRRGATREAGEPEGCQNPDLASVPAPGGLWEYRAMLFSFVYLVFVSLLKLLIGSL
jgi:hypothetical protein